MKNFTRALALRPWLSVAFHYPAYADTFRGLVVGITDGDTIKVLKDDKEQIKVRLVEIDAPEKRQAFGNRSKQTLSDYCLTRSPPWLKKGRTATGEPWPVSLATEWT